MEITTTRFGRLSVPEEEILHFKPGILGFERLVRYVLLEDEGGSPFRFLQALDDPDVAFVLVDPRWFRPDYQVAVPRSVLPPEVAGQPEEAEVFAIVTVRDDPLATTANLKAPIFLHRRARWGTQLVLVDTQYSTRHNIVEELRTLARRARQEEKRGPVLQAAPRA